MFTRNVFRPCPLLPPLKFSTVPINGDGLSPILSYSYRHSLHYADDNKKNTFNNDGNNGQGLIKVTCKHTFIVVLLVDNCNVTSYIR